MPNYEYARIRPGSHEGGAHPNYGLPRLSLCVQVRKQHPNQIRWHRPRGQPPERLARTLRVSSARLLGVLVTLALNRCCSLRCREWSCRDVGRGGAVVTWGVVGQW